MNAKLAQNSQTDGVNTVRISNCQSLDNTEKKKKIDLNNLIKSGDTDQNTIELVKSSSLYDSKHLESKLDSQISEHGDKQPTLLNNSRMVSVV